jgi:hypothetical protein
LGYSYWQHLQGPARCWGASGWGQLPGLQSLQWIHPSHWIGWQNRGHVGPQESQNEASFIWVTQGWNIPGRLCVCVSRSLMPLLWDFLRSYY